MRFGQFETLRKIFAVPAHHVRAERNGSGRYIVVDEADQFVRRVSLQSLEALACKLLVECRSEGLELHFYSSKAGEAVLAKGWGALTPEALIALGLDPAMLR